MSSYCLGGSGFRGLFGFIIGCWQLLEYSDGGTICSVWMMPHGKLLVGLGVPLVFFMCVTELASDWTIILDTFVG